jgi:DNA-nicking Smr family endonuclease
LKLKAPKTDAGAKGKAPQAAGAKAGAADAKAGAKGAADAKASPKAAAAATATATAEAAKVAAPAPKKGSKQEAESPTLEHVDAETFALYMAGVRALDHSSHRIPKTASRVERVTAKLPSQEELDEPARAKMRSLVTEGVRFESFDDGERLEGRRVDIDPREIRRLRRAEYAIDGTLDLHGMSLAEAREAVAAFVLKRSAEGDRVVAIIHGKGSHSPRGLGVLRGEIGAWLSGGRAARHVSAFATAPDDQGGTGALLVLLAR